MFWASLKWLHLWNRKSEFRLILLDRITNISVFWKHRRDLLRLNVTHTIKLHTSSFNGYVSCCKLYWLAVITSKRWNMGCKTRYGLLMNCQTHKICCTQENPQYSSKFSIFVTKWRNLSKCEFWYFNMFNILNTTFLWGKYWTSSALKSQKSYCQNRKALLWPRMPQNFEPFHKYGLHYCNDLWPLEADSNTPILPPVRHQYTHNQN